MSMAGLTEFVPKPILPAPRYIVEDGRDLTKEMFRDLIYNNDDPFKRELVSWDKVYASDIFNEFLEEVTKFSKLAKALESYDEKKQICFVQPEFNERQQLRCYFTDSYVTVSVNPKPKSTESKWTEIIQKHGADIPKDGNRYYEMKIMQDIQPEVWKLVLEGVKMCVKTVEDYLFGLVNNQQPIYEQMKLIRIGQPTDSEKKEEAKIQAWANREVLKEEKKLNMVAKMERRKQFWNNVFGIKDKISFH